MTCRPPQLDLVPGRSKVASLREVLQPVVYRGKFLLAFCISDSAGGDSKLIRVVNKALLAFNIENEIFF